MAFVIKDAKCFRAYRNGPGKTLSSILVRAPGYPEVLCIPFSVIDEDSEVWKEGTDGKLIVSEWFAEKNGWL